MGTELFLIIAGIVLRANDTWFGGAHTVGTICLVVGIIIATIEIIVLLAVLLAGGSAVRRTSRWR